MAGQGSAIRACGPSQWMRNRPARAPMAHEALSEVIVRVALRIRPERFLDAPRHLGKGLALEWIVNPHPEKQNTVLLDAVRNIGWLEGSPYAWVAGEFSQSLAIRAHLKASHQLGRNQMYASSYW